MSEKNKTSIPQESDEFGAFEGSAKTSADYFKAGSLYLVNVSKKPVEFDAPSQFTDKATGKPRIVKNYKIEVLDMESGNFVEIPTYAKLYLDMIAKRDAFLSAGLSLIQFKGSKLLPYVRNGASK